MKRYANLSKALAKKDPKDKKSKGKKSFKNLAKKGYY